MSNNLKRQEQERTYEYAAFISYNQHDTAWAKRIYQKLVGYRTPRSLRKQIKERERQLERKPFKKVFFAPFDLQAGDDLNEELAKKLKQSEYLIIICSPNAAQSNWVGKEINYFLSSEGEENVDKRKDNIHLFIIDGEPNSKDAQKECYHQVIKNLEFSSRVGANVNENIFPHRPWLNKRLAFAKLVSRMLRVPLQAIFRQQRVLLCQRLIAMALGICAIAAAIFVAVYMSSDVDVSVGLNEASVHNDNLPQLSDAEVTLMLDNEVKTDTLRTMEDQVVFANVPRRFLGKEVKMTVKCLNFVDVDTMIVLSREVRIDIRRIPDLFGKINFRLRNDKEQYVPNVVVEIEGQRAVSDADGRVIMNIPLERQRETYEIKASVPLETYLLSGEHTDCTTIDVR